MKATFAIAALFTTLVAASPANVLAFRSADITPEGLWKRWCDGSPVADPICPYGAFWCGPADGAGQCIPCGAAC